MRRKQYKLNWEKHPECKVEQCKDGTIKKWYQDYEDEEYIGIGLPPGSCGLRTIYCPTCHELWREEYLKIKRLEEPGKNFIKVPNSWENMFKYIKKSRSKT